MSLGHSVVILTHAYKDRTGVRYMTRGLKVYYLPILVMYNECTLPTLYATLPLVRYILIRERIDIVHGHSAFSALAHEAMMHGKTLGLKTVFTDHSLFGFADASAIITNKLLQMTLSLCDRVICVSHTGQENTALRAGVNPDKISVISNAVDTQVFTPDPSKRDCDRITIIVLSRLVYRKGVDLLAGVIPVICSLNSKVHFIVGGDGPKRIVLEEVIEHEQLQERVSLLGPVKHEDVRDLLVQGDIFLNCSLTEAFCMAIVEAAACGLQVVSTNVGGIPEVLPPDLVWLSDPSVEGLVHTLNQAIRDKESGKVVDPMQCHERIAKYYEWQDIARRTLVVYRKVEAEETASLASRLRKLLSCGFIWGQIFVIIALIEHVLYLFYSWLVPVETIDVALDYQEMSDVRQRKNSKIK